MKAKRMKIVEIPDDLNEEIDRIVAERRLIKKVFVEDMIRLAFRVKRIPFLNEIQNARKDQ